MICPFPPGQLVTIVFENWYSPWMNWIPHVAISDLAFALAVLAGVAAAWGGSGSRFFRRLYTFCIAALMASVLTSCGGWSTLTCGTHETGCTDKEEKAKCADYTCDG